MARLILHIGTHKTATTSIQRFFAQNRATLATRGVFYPGYDLIGKKPHYAHLGMVNALSGTHKSYSAEDARRFFAKVRERMDDYDTTVISAEPFYRHILGDAPGSAPDAYWPARAGYIEQIHDLLGDAQIAVVFRRQADYAQSLYQEHIKVTRYSKPFRDFLSDFWFHFAFLDQARAWNRVFPGLRAMSFEKLVASGDPVQEFARLLDLPCEDLPPAERHNEAMPVDMVIFKRLLQQANAAAANADSDSRARVEALTETLGPALFDALEPRSFFRSYSARNQFQASFDADNEALKVFLVHPYAAGEPTFPKAFKTGNQFGDTLHARVAQAVLDRALAAPSPTISAAAIPVSGIPAFGIAGSSPVYDQAHSPALGLTPTVVAGRTVLETPAQFSVFGDSHARFFFSSKDCPMMRCGFSGRRVKVSGEGIPAASVAGFRPKTSTLQTKDIILAALPDTRHLCLAFGQVDLELGYYFRKTIRQDQALTPASFVVWLLEVYEAFVRGLEFDPQAITLKGANLTVLRERSFALRYVSRIVSKDVADPQAAHATLEPLIMTETQQNAMTLAFNAGLQQICARHGMGYFDLNAALADPANPSPVLADQHRPAAFDHHLADTLAVRALHVQGLLESFGADPAAYRI